MVRMIPTVVLSGPSPRVWGERGRAWEARDLAAGPSPRVWGEL